MVDNRPKQEPQYYPVSLEELEARQEQEYKALVASRTTQSSSSSQVVNQQLTQEVYDFISCLKLHIQAESWEMDIS